MPSARKNDNGRSVDRFGSPAIDPSKNVEDSIESLKNYVDVSLKGHEKLSIERIKHVKYIAKLRATHSKELRDSDNKRLEAQRREDQATALADKTSVLGSVQTLAATTESVRLQLEKRVADSAETLAKATAENNKATEIRVSALEKIAFTGAGEKSIADPALGKLTELVTELVRANQVGGGERRGKSDQSSSVRNNIILGIAIVAFVLSTLLPFLNRPQQIQYIPAPATTRTTP